MIQPVVSKKTYEQLCDSHAIRRSEVLQASDDVLSQVFARRDIDIHVGTPRPPRSENSTVWHTNWRFESEDKFVNKMTFE
jgi:hypothetical protein